MIRMPDSNAYEEKNWPAYYFVESIENFRKSKQLSTQKENQKRVQDNNKKNQYFNGIVIGNLKPSDQFGLKK